MKINAKQFVEDFQAFIGKITAQSNWRMKYDSDSEWTKLIIGEKKSSEENSPLGNYFKNKYNINYRTEDGKYDLSMSFSNKMIVPTLNDKFQPIEYDTSKHYSYYPIKYDILVEHENNIYSSWDEVAKLIYARAFLKVLITYNSTTEHFEDEQKMMVETFVKMLSEMNKELKEDNRTEYLLLIGRVDNENLKWFVSCFNSNGNVISVL